ncbi:hypothetical protein GGH99_008255, partial [Coemansia sp. RSA 1285]
GFVDQRVRSVKRILAATAAWLLPDEHLASSILAGDNAGWETNAKLPGLLLLLFSDRDAVFLNHSNVMS